MASSPSRSLNQVAALTLHVVGGDWAGDGIRVALGAVPRLQFPRVLSFSEPDVLKGQFLVSKVIVSACEDEGTTQRIQKRLPPEEHRMVLHKESCDRFHIIQKLLLDLRYSLPHTTHFQSGHSLILAMSSAPVSVPVCKPSSGPTDSLYSFRGVTES